MTLAVVNLGGLINAMFVVVVFSRCPYAHIIAVVIVSIQLCGTLNGS